MQPINKYFGKHLHKFVASAMSSKSKITIKLQNKLSIISSCPVNNVKMIWGII